MAVVRSEYMKYVLILASVLALLGGVLLAGGGLFLMFYDATGDVEYNIQLQSLIETALDEKFLIICAFIMVGLGVVVFIFACIGWVITRAHRQHLALYLFILPIFLTTLASVALGVYPLTRSLKVTREVLLEQFQFMLKTKYASECDSISTGLAALSKEQKCCGIESFTDFKTSPWYARNQKNISDPCIDNVIKFDRTKKCVPYFCCRQRSRKEYRWNIESAVKDKSREEFAKILRNSPQSVAYTDFDKCQQETCEKKEFKDLTIRAIHNKSCFDFLYDFFVGRVLVFYFYIIPFISGGMQLLALVMAFVVWISGRNELTPP